MAAPVLTDQSDVKCSHQGKATAIPSQRKARAQSGTILLETDKHLVAGCSFMKGQMPSPCIRIEWSNGASKVSGGGTAEGKVLETKELSLDIPANADTAQAHAQTISTLIEKVAVEAAVAVRNAKP